MLRTKLAFDGQKAKLATNFNQGFRGSALNLHMQQYNPVPRAFYDALEELHLLKTPFNITFEDDFGRKTLLEVRSTDLFSDEGAEWMMIDKGIRIRLDNIVAINGKPAQYMA